MKKRLKNISVLITGAEGFIGSHLTRLLLESGAKVNALVHPRSSLGRIEDILKKITVYPVDLRDKIKLKQALFKADPVKIFHLAANLDHNRSVGLLDEIFRDNFYGTLNLLDRARKLDIDCLVTTGTCEEYGTNKAPFTEAMRECPVSPYSLSKVCSSYLASMFHNSYHFPVVTVRPFLTYGPGQDANMFIPSLILSCLKGRNFKMTRGEQTREFNYVSDIAGGFLKASITPRAIGEVINLGNGREYKIARVARLIKKLTGAKIKLGIGKLAYRPGEAMRFFSSPGKAKRLLRWKGEIGLEEGLRKTIAWYRKN